MLNYIAGNAFVKGLARVPMSAFWFEVSKGSDRDRLPPNGQASKHVGPSVRRAKVILYPSIVSLTSKVCLPRFALLGVALRPH